jgi:hypothetical protein
MGNIKAGVFIGPRNVSSSENFNLISLYVMMRSQLEVPFDMTKTDFVESVKAVNFRKLMEDLPLLMRNSVATCHPRCISSMGTWDSVLVNCGTTSDGTRHAFSTVYLSDAEYIQAQMECCHIS